MEHVVLPVFYDVSPSVVLEQSGIYAEAFAKHERDPVNAINVPKWRAAMATAANLAGIDAQNIRLEAQLVEEIVNDVHRKLIAISSYGPSLGTFGSNGYGSELVSRSYSRPRNFEADSSWINSENSGLNSKANSSCRGVRNADPASLSQIPQLHDLQEQGQQKFQTPLAHQQFQGRQPSSAHVQHAMGQGQLSQGNQLSRLAGQLSSQLSSSGGAEYSDDSEHVYNDVNTASCARSAIWINWEQSSEESCTPTFE